MNRARTAAAGLALALPLAGNSAVAQDVPVDLELILAVDVSQSVDFYEGRLQREGYVLALRDPRIGQAIANGILGQIAVIYLEWAGPGLWRRVVDWTLVTGVEDAEALAQQLLQTPIARGTGTSITGILQVAAPLFDDNGYDSDRLVIDISGDGPNSAGGIVSRERDEVVAAGITINGVAINNFDGSNFTLPDLDVYYEECVIGGASAFVLAADGFESFADAILRKLILEIAGLAPDPTPVLPLPADAPIVHFAQLEGLTRPLPRGGAPKYAPACDIGERMRLQDNPNLQPLPPPVVSPPAQP